MNPKNPFYSIVYPFGYRVLGKFIPMISEGKYISSEIISLSTREKFY